MSRIAAFGVVRQRDPRVRDKAYLGWIAQLPCLKCACQGRATWPVHVCHIRAGFPTEAGWREFGKAEKPHDAHVWPGCAGCHLDGPEAQHRMNELEFWRRMGIYPPDFCQALRRAYETGASGVRVIRSAVLGSFPFPDEA